MKATTSNDGDTMSKEFFNFLLGEKNVDIDGNV